MLDTIISDIKSGNISPDSFDGVLTKVAKKTVKIVNKIKKENKGKFNDIKFS